MSDTISAMKDYLAQHNARLAEMEATTDAICAIGMHLDAMGRASVAASEARVRALSMLVSLTDAERRVYACTDPAERERATSEYRRIALAAAAAAEDMKKASAAERAICAQRAAITVDPDAVRYDEEAFNAAVARLKAAADAECATAAEGGRVICM